VRVLRAGRGAVRQDPSRRSPRQGPVRSSGSAETWRVVRLPWCRRRRPTPYR
jgi:hypothetical protein